MFKTTWKLYFKINGKNTWKFTKKPGKIMEISWNFVNLKKWEACKCNSRISCEPFTPTQSVNIGIYFRLSYPKTQVVSINQKVR